MISTFLLVIIASGGGQLANPLMVEYSSMEECLAGAFVGQDSLGALPWPYIHANSCLTNAGKATTKEAKFILTYRVSNDRSSSVARIGLESAAQCYKYAQHLQANTFDPDGKTYSSIDCKPRKEKK